MPDYLSQHGPMVSRWTRGDTAMTELLFASGIGLIVLIAWLEHALFGPSDEIPAEPEESVYRLIPEGLCEALRAKLADTGWGVLLEDQHRLTIVLPADCQDNRQRLRVGFQGEQWVCCLPQTLKNDDTRLGAITGQLHRALEEAAGANYPMSVVAQSQFSS